jgi:16S rRNA (guanine527-N7)-methyltransferase
MALNKAEAERLVGAARELGVELDDDAVRLLGLFMAELVLWSRRIDLVSERDRSRLIDRHLLDALAAAPPLRTLGPAAQIADLGSGAGLPGIPLAIVLGAHMTLVEPRRKRASFLRAVSRVLTPVRLEVFQSPAAELIRRGREFDGVVSRATFDGAELLALGEKLLRPGGILVGYQSASRTSDARVSDAAMAVPGFSGPIRSTYSLPAQEHEFALAVWTRERFT